MFYHYTEQTPEVKFSEDKIKTGRGDGHAWN